MGFKEHKVLMRYLMIFLFCEEKTNKSNKIDYLLKSLKFK